jgi:hypothetical protein
MAMENQGDQPATAVDMEAMPDGCQQAMDAAHTHRQSESGKVAMGVNIGSGE